MVNEHFLPPVEPYAEGLLEVDEPHSIFWEECGRADGEPVVFLHGGPGVGSTPVDRRFFDPAAFRVVLLDQRGCGRSRPHGELRANTIDHLTRDLERLREARGIESWHVFGGSWGSTLALHYAEEHPERCRSLVLRGIWLMRRAEIDWWLYGLRWLRPESWRRFAEIVPEDGREDLLEAYWRLLTGPDRARARTAARRWSRYEAAACTLLPDESFSSGFESDELAWSLARLEAHYFRARPFASDAQLLERADRLRPIPGFAVHGRYDLVAPVRNLDDLRAVWPELSCRIVPDAGHSSHEPGITRELVAAMGRIRDTGTPVPSERSEPEPEPTP